jgi:hypothetical protein
LQAAEVGRERGWLAPDEYLKAKSAGLAQAKIERDFIAKQADGLYRSKEYENYLNAKSEYTTLVDLAEDTSTSINDFTFIQRYLKLLDPDSATLQGEIDAAKMSAAGMQSLRNVFGSSEAASVLAGLMRFQAGGGNVLRLNATQKKRLLDAAETVIGGRQKAAIARYNQAQSTIMGLGGSAKQFERATRAGFNEISFSAEGYREGRGITSGNMPGNWLGLREMRQQNRETVNAELLQLGEDAGSLLAELAIATVKGPVGKGMDKAGEAADKAYKGFIDSAGDLMFEYLIEPNLDKSGAANLIAPEQTSMLLERAYQHGNRQHNVIEDILNGGTVSSMSLTSSVLPLVTAPRRKRKRRLVRNTA